MKLNRRHRRRTGRERRSGTKVAATFAARNERGTVPFKKSIITERTTRIHTNQKKRKKKKRRGKKKKKRESPQTGAAVPDRKLSAPEKNTRRGVARRKGWAGWLKGRSRGKTKRSLKTQYEYIIGAGTNEVRSRGRGEGDGLRVGSRSPYFPTARPETH